MKNLINLEYKNILGTLEVFEAPLPAFATNRSNFTIRQHYIIIFATLRLKKSTFSMLQEYY